MKSINSIDLETAVSQIKQACDKSPKIENSQKLKLDNPVIWGQQGYIEFLSGNRNEARVILTRTIKIVGEKTKQTILKHCIDHLQQDEEFQELVRSIPAPAAKES